MTIKDTWKQTYRDKRHNAKKYGILIYRVKSALKAERGRCLKAVGRCGRRSNWWLSAALPLESQGHRTRHLGRATPMVVPIATAAANGRSRSWRRLQAEHMLRRFRRRESKESRESWSQILVLHGRYQLIHLDHLSGVIRTSFQNKIVSHAWLPRGVSHAFQLGDGQLIIDSFIATFLTDLKDKPALA